MKRADKRLVRDESCWEGWREGSVTQAFKASLKVDGGEDLGLPGIYSSERVGWGCKPDPWQGRMTLKTRWMLSCARGYWTEFF